MPAGFGGHKNPHRCFAYGEKYLWIDFETIADFTDAFNKNGRGIIGNAYFSAKIADVVAYGIFFVSRWQIAPHLIINLCVCKDTPFVCRQQTKQLIFLNRQFNLLILTNYSPVTQVNFQAGK